MSSLLSDIAGKRHIENKDHNVERTNTTNVAKDKTSCLHNDGIVRYDNEGGKNERERAEKGLAGAARKERARIDRKFRRQNICT